MSDYLTLAQGKEALSRQLELWFKESTGAIDDVAFQADIDDVEAEINTHLRLRYNVPVTSTEGQKYLKSLTIDLLRYKGYKRLGTGEVPDSIFEDSREAVKALIALQKGRQRLPETVEQVDPNSPDDSIFVQNNDAIFRQDDLKRY